MNPMQLMANLQKQQALPEVRVACNPNGHCWCMNITPIASPDESLDGRCMTPAEMLEHHGDKLPVKDVVYLRKIIANPTYDFEEQAL